MTHHYGTTGGALMAKILFQVEDGEKQLWVQAAENEQLTLSEWLRRAARNHLNRGPTPEGVSFDPPTIEPVKEPTEPGGSPAQIPDEEFLGPRAFKGPDLKPSQRKTK